MILTLSHDVITFKLTISTPPPSLNYTHIHSSLTGQEVPNFHGSRRFTVVFTKASR
jgi:hypothetical protein